MLFPVIHSRLKNMAFCANFKAFVSTFMLVNRSSPLQSKKEVGILEYNTSHLF